MSPVHQTPDNAVILVVDDTDPIRYARSRILSQAGYRMIEASTGEEALRVAVLQQPHLIVLDVNLPDIDGLEVCRRLKSDQKTSHIMVLQVSSTRTSKLDLAAGIERGADSYLIEPIDPLELLATVKALLRLAERERQLWRSERQFAEATSAADCGLWDWDIISGKLKWFGAHERLAGMAPGGFSGKIEAFSDILHPEDRTRVWNKLQNMMTAREEHFADDYRFVHPDGSVHWMTARGRFFYDDAGRAVRMTGVVQDITRRKEAEEFTRRITDVAPSILYVYDLEERRNVWGNREMFAALGYNHDQLSAMAGKLLETLLHPDDWLDYLGHAERLTRLADGEVAQFEYRMRRTDGTYRWLQSRDMVFQRTSGGRVRQIAGSALDITERKEAEQALKSTAESLALAQRVSHAGVWDWHMTEGPEAFVSTEYRALYGLGENEPVTYDTWLSLVHPDDRDRIERYGRQLFGGEGDDYQTEFRIVHPVHGERWLAGIGKVKRNEIGEPVRFTGVNLDVTDRKRTEEAVRRSEEQLRRVLEAMHVFVGVLTPDGIMIQCNTAPIVAAGLRRDEVIGMHFADSFWWNYSEESNRRIRRDIERAAHGERIRYDAPVRVRNSKREAIFIDVDFALTPMFDETGRVTHLIPIGVDISERARSQKALRESEEFNRTILESNPDCVKVLDARGALIMMNRQGLCRMEIDDFSAVQGKLWWELWPESSRDRIRDAMARAGRGEEVVRFEDFCPTAKGTPKWWDVQVSSVRNADGVIERFVSISRDVTERKRQEVALRESELFYRQTLESIPGMAFTNQADGSCDYVSQQWVDFTGIPASEHFGSGWVQVLHPDDRERAFAAWRAAVEGRGQYDLEYRVRRHDGQYRWFKVRGRAIRDEDDTIVRWFGTAVNVDDLKHIEEALRENEAQLRLWKNELEVRVRERTSELLATQERLMTVTSQLSLTEQKERRKLARDLHDYLAQMLVVGQMKTKMLKKHLSSNPTGATFAQDLEKVFQQALTYTRTLIAELSPPSLHESGLAAALTWLAERFEKDGLRVSVRVDCDAVPLPEEQAVVVFQAVREFLFNVLKHAGVDRATVIVTLDEDDVLRVAVGDKGKGFGSDATERSAEPGHLGLISVRERFQAMGGRVEVLSTRGQGTTVTLVLPLGSGQSRGRSGEERAGLPTDHSSLSTPQQIRVLLVDDHQLVRQGLRDTLAGEDRIRVVGEAQNGVEALMLAASLVPDVVIMDVNLPDMDGIEATKRFKRLHPQMVVIGLSYHTDQHVARDMVAAGAQTLLSKGGAAEELTAAIVKSYSERAMAPQ